MGKVLSFILFIPVAIVAAIAFWSFIGYQKIVYFFVLDDEED